MNQADYYLLGELMGEDALEEDEEFDVMGARMFPTRRIPRGTARVDRRQRIAAKASLRRSLVPSIPGTPAAGAREWPLGFGTFSFTAVSGTVGVLQAEPQRPFKGQRLVIDIARTGATATGLVTVNVLQVGQDNQLVSAQALPAGGFAPDAFHTVLDLDPATPGIIITLNVGISIAPGGQDQVDVSAMIIGTAIG